MDKAALKQRIKEDAHKIKNDLEAKIKDIDWKEKLSRTRSFFKKNGKKLYQDFKALPRNVKRAVLIGIIALMPTVQVVKFIDNKVEDFKEKKELQKREKDVKQRLEEKHVVSDAQSFEKLYEDALPLIQLSMFPTECLVLDPYADNCKKVSNTIGLGSYWYPQNGDPKSSKWVKASEHFKNSGHHSISAELALDLADGWYRYREDGRIYKKMRNLLKDTELNIHEFAAIATVMYNNEQHGETLCKFVQKNYDDPLLCAQKIVEFSAGKSFGGIPKRHLHEAYLYLNYDNYSQKMYDFFVKTGVNSKGQFYAQTSVSQLCDEDVAAGKEAIKSGDKQRIIAEQNKIVSYICKGGQTVGEIIHQNVLNPTYATQLLSFNTTQKEGVALEDVIDSKDANSAAQTYREAIAKYDNALRLEKNKQKGKAQKEFQRALEDFQKIIDGGHDGPDLHNDMAITYYHLGEYEKCIQESAKVLKMGDKDLYPAANYNAAKAYEAMGNYPKALQNYRAGIKNGGKEATFQKEISRLEKQNQEIITQGHHR